MTPEGFRNLVDTNLNGYFLVARALAPRLVAQARFVTISVSGETTRRRGFAPYGPSRAATDSLSAVMTEDLLPYGIAVNVLLRAVPPRAA